jgi:putative PIN family toxin of toxin-antitoxin system
MAMPAEPVVLDTNVVLDLLVFRDAAAQPIRAALDEGRWQWLATRPMRDELERVLAYPRVAPRVAFYQLHLQDVLAAFDRQALIVDAPPKAPVTCADADDQGFIDLAVAHRARLFSKDQAVLSMRKRLLPLGVEAARPSLPVGGDHAVQRAVVARG